MRRASAMASFCFGVSEVSFVPASRSSACRRSIASSNADLAVCSPIVLSSGVCSWYAGYQPVSPCGTSGRARRRRPVAAKIAPATAGATADDRRLAGARGRQVLAVEEDDLDLRHVAEARHAVARQRAFWIAPVVERDGLEERAAEALTSEPSTWFLSWSGLTTAPHSNAATTRTTRSGARLGVDRDLGAGRDVAAFLDAAGDPEARVRRRLRLAPIRTAPRPRRARPASRASFRFLQAELERVELREPRASSSMCDSRAKWFAVAASPRYEPWRSGERAGWNSMCWFAAS